MSRAWRGLCPIDSVNCLAAAWRNRTQGPSAYLQAPGFAILWRDEDKQIVPGKANSAEADRGGNAESAQPRVAGRYTPGEEIERRRADRLRLQDVVGIAEIDVAEPGDRVVVAEQVVDPCGDRDGLGFDPEPEVDVRMTRDRPLVVVAAVQLVLVGRVQPREQVPVGRDRSRTYDKRRIDLPGCLAQQRVT